MNATPAQIPTWIEQYRTDPQTARMQDEEEEREALVLFFKQEDQQPVNDDPFEPLEPLDDRAGGKTDPLPVVPALLKAIPNWVEWRKDEARGKVLKIAGTKFTRNAKSHDPTTWVSYETVIMGKPAIDSTHGVGFVLNGGQSKNLVTWDIDGCRNSQTGEITKWAKEILTALGNPYTEITPSGSGIRPWVIGINALSTGKKNKEKFLLAKTAGFDDKVQIEIFADGQFVTVTGNHVAGTSTEIPDRGDLSSVLRLCESIAVKYPSNPSAVSNPSASELYNKKPISANPNGDKIPLGQHDDTLHAIAGLLRHQGLEEEAIYNALVEVCEKRCEGYGSDYLDMCRKHARNICAKPPGNPLENVVLVGGKIAGTQIVEPRESSGPLPPPFETESDESSPYDMTETEIAEQEASEYPVYRLHEGAGPQFDEDILYGPVGEVAKRMAKYNESHVAAIYLNLLVSLGNLFGRGPHFTVNRTEHYLNEFLACAGDSSTARKGTGSDEVNDFLSLIASEWLDRRNVGGFGSPQGIIYQIRDDSTYQKLDSKTGIYNTIVKPGIGDKRLCIREGELSNVLKLMAEPKFRADELLRNAWDGKKLENLVAGMTEGGENKSVVCRKPHVSIIGYTTGSLMKATMPSGADNSGSGNRFLYAYVKRLKLVPMGGPRIEWGTETMDYKGEKVSFLVYFYEMMKEAHADRNIPLTPAARKYWENTYLKMERNKWQGFVGRMTSRGAAHVRRLATIFALADRENAVEIRHLQAALGIWEYSRQSVRYIFVGYTKEQEKILKLAHEKGTEGISGRDVHALFNRHKTGEWVQTHLKALVEGGWIIPEGERYQFRKW